MITNKFTPCRLRFAMTYGKRLKKALDAANKSRKQLAFELDCTVQAIGMVITGGGKLERGLSAENNVKAAKYLRVDSYWLATGDGEMVQDANAAGKAAASLSEDALDIAVYFDKLQDREARTVAYVATMAEILKALAALEAKSAAQATAAQEQSENPKKQCVGPQVSLI